jgi:hypothetical protein
MAGGKKRGDRAGCERGQNAERRGKDAAGAGPDDQQGVEVVACLHPVVRQPAVFGDRVEGVAQLGHALLCVPKTPSTLCDQVILVDQATDVRPSSYAVPRKIGGLG